MGRDRGAGGVPDYLMAWVLVITPRRHDSGTINLGKGVLERITMVETCLGGGWKM